MRLFEAIVDANHRAVAGDNSAGLHPADFADELPVIALTCIDPRLNALFPNVLGLPGDQFIWLRNAGNIITGTLSSTMRSLALACAVKGGREIAIIGHTDCHVAKTTTSVLLDELKSLGVERSNLPDNVSEFFGTFGSERQNVIKACDFTRQSPLIGPKIPVHGLLVDIATGKLDWVVNGYETLQSHSQPTMAKTNFSTLGALGSFKDFEMGEMKFPEMKIGDAALPGKPIHVEIQTALVAAPTSSAPPPLKNSPLPPIKMAPPTIKPHQGFRRS
jgi:carbonic anhydrase